MPLWARPPPPRASLRPALLGVRFLQMPSCLRSLNIVQGYLACDMVLSRKLCVASCKRSALLVRHRVLGTEEHVLPAGSSAGGWFRLQGIPAPGPHVPGFYSQNWGCFTNADEPHVNTKNTNSRFTRGDVDLDVPFQILR